MISLGYLWIHIPRQITKTSACAFMASVVMVTSFMKKIIYEPFFIYSIRESLRPLDFEYGRTNVLCCTYYRPLFLCGSTGKRRNISCIYRHVYIYVRICMQFSVSSCSRVLIEGLYVHHKNTSNRCLSIDIWHEAVIHLVAMKAKSTRVLGWWWPNISCWFQSALHCHNVCYFRWFRSHWLMVGQKWQLVKACSFDRT